MTKILVLDGATTQALACVRALGRAGHTLLVAGDEPSPLAAWSRYCSGRYRVRGETLEGFAALRDWARQEGVEVVLPQTERSCILCNLDRTAWESAGIIVGCAPEEQLVRAFDKAYTWQFAEACGVRLPAHHIPQSLSDGRTAAEQMGFPVVVKSRFSHYWTGDEFISSGGTHYARNRVEIDAALQACRQGPFWPVIQEFVSGRGKGLFALYDHGTPLAWFAHERLRDVRPSGSGSSLRRAIALEDRLLAPAARLLNLLRWHGPAMVEFRDDDRGGAPCLIELNGRFWGSLELAIAAGVDFPTLWLQVLQGAPRASQAPYATGVTRRWWWGDAKRLLHIAKGAPRGYPEPFPNLLTGLKEVLGPQPPGTRSETWSADDPAPALGEWVQGVRSLLPRFRTNGNHASATRPIRVLMVTSGWPQPGQPQTTHFIKRQADFLRAAGVDVEVFPFRGGRNPWNYVRAWFGVRRRLLRGRYDLVHAQFGQSGLLALPTRLPLVVTYRGSDILGIVGPGGRYRRIGRVLQWAARLVARCATAVVVVSEHMKRHLPSSVKATVLPSGLDFSLFQPIPRDDARRQLALPLNRRLVLFAGNPDLPRKRHDLALATMRLLDPSLRADLTVAWGVPHKQMPILMSACDALLFTSMQEGSPNVVKEALACNLPVVSVSVGDVAERLAGIEGCEVCADGKPETLAAALRRVLERGGRIAGHDAVSLLDEHAITARLIGVYEEALRRPHDIRTPTPPPMTQQVRNVG